MTLLNLKVPELRLLCKQHGIPHSKLNKQQLVERLQAAGIAFITENSASSDHPTSTAKTTPLKRASKKNKQTTPTLQDPINPIASDVTPTQPIVAPLIEAIDSVEGSRETTTISAPSTKPPTSAPSVAVQNGISGPSRPAIKSATPKKPLIPHQTARKRAEPYANNAPKIINKRVKVQLKPSSNPLQTVKPVERLQAQEAVLVSNTEYIRSHFVERLYRWADSGRREPQNRQPAFTGLDALLQEPALTFLSASRFFIARLHTLLQLGTFDLVTSVVNCTLVAGDIWHIKLSDDSTFHFIGATGEVVGSPDLRSDWQAYLASPSPLIKHVQTKGGVLFRVGVDVALAERIILTSCALNSFSGSKQSALSMDAEWIGNPGSAIASKRLEFYLAESRQLISLHPTPHASVIYAQFNDFAAYVLRETGQMIGSEEGISCLWQGILGCGPTAESREVSAFWQDWETRSLRAEL